MFIGLLACVRGCVIRVHTVRARMISVHRMIPVRDALVASCGAFPMLSVWTAFAPSDAMMAVEHAFRVFLVLAR